MVVTMSIMQIRWYLGICLGIQHAEEIGVGFISSGFERLEALIVPANVYLSSGKETYLCLGNTNWKHPMPEMQAHWANLSKED